MRQRVAIYTRVSTQEQATHGYSIEEQSDRAEKYCDAMGWNIYHIYTDAGFSGGNTNRPALQKLITDVKAGKVDKVLVYKLDRLSRSQLDTLYLIEKIFLANNTDFASISENFDTSTPFGRAMIGILAVFAQLEREQIKERMMMGLTARAKKGKFHGSAHIPIGYDYIDGELIVNDFERVQVQTAFKMCASGSSATSIMNYLNNAGLNHRYGVWTGKAVKRVLTSRTYLGEIKFDGQWYQGTHEPIIDKETFDKVQGILQHRHDNYIEKHQRAGRANSYLGGYIYCAMCGAKYFRSSYTSIRKGEPNKVPIYTCNSRAKKNPRQIKDPSCRNKNWHMQDLDDLVFNEIRKLSLDGNNIHQPKTDNISKNIVPIENEIKSLDHQLSRLMDLYTVGDIPLDILQNKIFELNETKTKLETELDKLLTQSRQRLSNETAKQVINSFDEILNRGSFDEIRSVIETLIDKVEIDGDDVTIYWNFS